LLSYLVFCLLRCSNQGAKEIYTSVVALKTISFVENKAIETI